MARAMTWQGDVHDKTFWIYGVWAGLIAGAVFMAAEMMLVWLIQGASPWGPPRMIAAIALGEEALPPPASFDLVIFVAAMLVHFVLSIVLGLVGAWLVHRFDLAAALGVGAVFGLAIYLVNFHLLVPAVFSWFVMARNPITIAAHILFGVVLTGAYIGLRARHRSRATQRR